MKPLAKHEGPNLHRTIDNTGSLSNQTIKQADVLDEPSFTIGGVTINRQTQLVEEGAELGTYHCVQIKRFSSDISRVLTSKCSDISTCFREILNGLIPCKIVAFPEPLQYRSLDPQKLSRLTSGRSLDGFSAPLVVFAPVAGLATAVAGLAAASLVALAGGFAVSVTVVPQVSQQGGLASMRVVGPKQLLHRKESGSLVEPFPFPGNVDPQAYFTRKRRQEAKDRGEYVDIHDIDGVDPKDFDVLIPDIEHGKLQHEIAEIVGIAYHLEASKEDANKIIGELLKP
ncbi:hypothetical protein P167DRAFT_571886 [Morchella conica CCBAS932]|uniref:Uncharacterized protein n=1 Tax=Morchella conica CCBAS932 TaxID=1392247 RepID=A0A3N4L330_9PEZI|nr:hypothetical protein P167DRAFT_571886 [Morchella conica CCBAS932]